MLMGSRCAVYHVSRAGAQLSTAFPCGTNMCKAWASMGRHCCDLSCDLSQDSPITIFSLLVVFDVSGMLDDHDAAATAEA